MRCFNHGPNAEIRVYTGEYKGKNLLHARLYRRDRAGAFYPTGTGIASSDFELMRDIGKALVEIADGKGTGRPVRASWTNGAWEDA